MFWGQELTLGTAVALGCPSSSITLTSGQIVINKFFRSVSLLLAACLIASCSDSALQSPTAPVASGLLPAADAFLPTVAGVLPDAGHFDLKALWWKDRHNDVVQVSKEIGPLGGTISVPTTGLTVVFPAGALSAPLTITVTSDESYVAYKMEPTGTRFDRDVVVTQLLSFTELAGEPLNTHLFAAYIADDRTSLSGNVPVLEIEPSHTIFSLLSGLPVAQVWLIKHFSRYMLASG